MVGLGNVTNVSQATMFTTPQFTGAYAYIGADTIATRAYARLYGGGGGGAGVWGGITGTLAAQTDLQAALDAKLATNGSAASLTGFPTLNQNTTGSAAKWTTARTIWGNSIDGTSNITSIIASTYGGTGNGFTKFAGPTTAERTFTLPNATATILTSNAAVTVAQGGTGVSTLTTAYGLIAAGTTATGTVQTLAAGSIGQILRSGGSSTLPSWSTATFPSTAGTSGKVLKSDGANFISSTETYAAPGTSGNIMLSDGTNWTSDTPVDYTTVVMLKHPTVTAKVDSYTLQLTDDGTIITMDKSSATNLTVPPNSSVAFPTGTQITILCLGAGKTTVVAGSGVTITSRGSYLGITVLGDATLIKLATNTWKLIGSLE
jgi:hypothetical protein